MSDELRVAFLIYLISHDRPIAELIAPTRKPIDDEFRRGFDGMAREPVSLEDLMTAREAIITEMVGGMPEGHRRFLIGFKQGGPDWNLAGFAGGHLPAVRWKQRNLDRLSAGRRAGLAAALETLLFGSD